MNEPQPAFTDEQVVTAIRAAYSPRWDTSLSEEDAAAHAATYRSNLAHYRQHVQRSLDESDYLQVAEKSWGAFTQVVKAIGADHRIKLSSHVGIMRVAGELAKLIAQTTQETGSKVSDASVMVHSLHLHFYENELPDDRVIQSAATVSQAIDLLQDYFPPPSEH
ncbi:MAG: hypothetical protein OXI54_06980 [Chloroflexota bacterium]|nr:hypothetical protein [Chloroflexota bacterium]MDE2683878.1 hypothetical protein [Chloroflexota bacterium]